MHRADLREGFTRTRVGFEVAAYDQGAHVTYLGPSGTQIGHKETMKDTARVLGRIYDAIEYRGFSQKTVEELAKFSGVPVYNGLTDQYHPTQVLADLLTMQEHSEKPLSQVSFCFSAMPGTIWGIHLIGGAKMGMDVRLCAPKSCWPDKEIIANAEKTAAETGARVMVTENVEQAAKGCDFLYTDVWLSDGRARGEVGRAHQAAEAVPGEHAGHEVDGETLHQVHALPACIPQYGDGAADIEKKLD